LTSDLNTIKERNTRGCSLLPDGGMALPCYNAHTVSFINTEGVELFQIGKDETRSDTYDVS
jgi:hypothetical protein